MKKDRNLGSDSGKLHVSLAGPNPEHMDDEFLATAYPKVHENLKLINSGKIGARDVEVKRRLILSADVLASIRSKLPTGLLNNYSRNKLDNLKRVWKEIFFYQSQKGKDEEKQDLTYSIGSTDKVNLEEFDLKSALFSHMNKKKSANKNMTNYHLYHALMEALIADEDAIDKEVADKLDQTRAAKPPLKNDDQSSKKPRESDASASKQHLALTSTGWQITDTRDAGADSSMHKSDPDSGHSEQSSDDISMQDEGNDSDIGDKWTFPRRFPGNQNMTGQMYHTHNHEQERKQLCKADFEGPTLNLVKAFHKEDHTGQKSLPSVPRQKDLGLSTDVIMCDKKPGDKWSEVDKRRKQRLLSLQFKKRHTDQKDLSKSRKLCWRRIRDIDYRSGEGIDIPHRLSDGEQLLVSYTDILRWRWRWKFSPEMSSE
ncbi:hypothetical protein Tco_0031398 [Tanacetum coccineum]